MNRSDLIHHETMGRDMYRREADRPLVIDLYCGAGLVADGLIDAGFDVLGVDIENQPRYPGPFLRHDALTLDERLLDMADAIWASPPCLRDTSMRYAPNAKGEAHPDLITPTRVLLRRWAARTGGCYVIENVETAALLDPVVLCGSMFELGVDDCGCRYHLERHRKFEANWPLSPPRACQHVKPVVGIYGGHARVRAASAGGRGTKEPWSRPGVDIMHEAMGLKRRMTSAEISQGIPPAYAEHVGHALLAHLTARRAAA